MNKPELLAPCGDFECLKAAVQNGADSVYLGTGAFNARVRATNFDHDTLKEAIVYAKLRNVKVHVTLNILIKDNEFENAVKLALEVYNMGADALIIQDLGLMEYLLKHYSQIPVHASTQMTTHNLAGVKQLESMGVSRVVLSRELPINEIKNICENSNVEIETFIHGALCISYSGQCLFSSIIGGRSGNRGLCAQPCRLPYSLINESGDVIDTGHLLSPRDLIGTKFLPELIRMGVKCFKIEGRLKSPEYVGIITRFYRKYIDLVLGNPTLSNEEIVDVISAEMAKQNPSTSMSDLEEVTQVFNRGGFSNGHYSTEPNRQLVFKNKPNNSGFYLGKIEKFNSNKGYITFKTSAPLSIGDKVSVNSDVYTISELMINGDNIKNAHINDIITIGRIKGKIKPGLEVYKLQSKVLNDNIAPTFKENKEFRKQEIVAKVSILKDKPIQIEISCDDENSIYYNETLTYISEIIPSDAINAPTTRDKIIEQISKTGDTPFEFKAINLELDDNLFITISSLNELRRNALIQFMNRIIDRDINSRNLQYSNIDTIPSIQSSTSTPYINLLLEYLDMNFDYCNLNGFNRLFIPLKYFTNLKFKNKLLNLCSNFNTYIYLPNIIRDNIKISFDYIVNSFNIKGFIVSNISQLDIVSKYNLELLGNYTLNVYNSFTCASLQAKGISEICITPELNDSDTYSLISNSPIHLELMVYGKIPFMTTNYCLLGKSNKCYEKCSKLCMTSKKFYIKDRLGLDFRIIPDNTNTITTIYNSKITSFDYGHYNVNSIRISILDESFDKIQNIIDTVKSSRRFEGEEYCGHFNK